MHPVTRAILEQELATHGSVRPPWARFPEYTRYSLGWRMGGGEDWIQMFWEWLSSTDPSRDARVSYLRSHARAPRTWANVVSRILGDDTSLDRHRATPEETQALITEGLVGDDVAYSAWLGNDQGELVPWATHYEGPEDMLRYAARELWFWVRKQRASSTALDLTPKPAWKEFVDTMRTGSATDLLPERAFARGAIELALHGVLTPPWALGLTPECVRDDYDDDPGYGDVWRLWHYSVFDDRPTFDAYCHRFEPPADDWARWVDKEVLSMLA